jgi:hypothetical protein
MGQFMRGHAVNELPDEFVEQSSHNILIPPLSL